MPKKRWNWSKTPSIFGALTFHFPFGGFEVLLLHLKWVKKLVIRPKRLIIKFIDKIIITIRNRVRFHTFHFLRITPPQLHPLCIPREKEGGQKKRKLSMMDYGRFLKLFLIKQKHSTPKEDEYKSISSSLFLRCCCSLACLTITISLSEPVAQAAKEKKNTMWNHVISIHWIKCSISFVR